MESMKLDILAFGAHADDVEIGMGGTIAKYAAQGLSIGICDLTEAELSSNGNVALRKAEAKQAAQLLNVEVRETLCMKDRGLFLNQDYIRQAAGVIRKYRPAIVFAPYMADRHPDHGNAARIVEEAVFSAGVKKYETTEKHNAHKVRHMYYYMINGFHTPDFVVDISEFIDNKISSLQAYRSQFVKTDESVDTPLVNGYVEMIEARERLYGQQVGLKYAEGFKVKKPIIIDKDLIGV
ncbi:bacillithiol biosynthesis deacetylase BshB1 [Cytobacillus horneckiae]|uniref:bacillithiol biosynthesis deacetylase BshB1 n=1 Tax=Cytobacillus horneckiae TaxID=549687 RepID=UPI003D9A2407